MSDFLIPSDNGQSENQAEHIATDVAAGWEYCEITGHTSLRMETYTAQAIGPAGFYIVAEAAPLMATEIIEESSQERKKTVDKLIQQLQKDGWEAINARGAYWYNYRFRRRLSDDAHSSVESEHWTTFAEAISDMLTRPGSIMPESISSKLGSTTRSWAIQHLTQGDEEAYDKAALAIRNTVRFAADSVASALGHPPAREQPDDLSVMPPNSPKIIFTEVPQPQEPVTDSFATQAVFSPDTPSVSSQEINTITAAVPFNAESSSNLRPVTDAMLDKIKAGATALAEDHAVHLAMRRNAEPVKRSLVARMGLQVKFTAQRTLFVITILIEIKPDAYGPGDFFALAEAIIGWTLDGLKLSKLERIMYAVIAVIPFVPARPVVGFYRRVEPWLRSEDTLTQRAATANKLRGASGALAGAGWYFLRSQLPRWLQDALPDPLLDKQYPRSASYRFFRILAGLAWFPFLTFFTIAAANALLLLGKSQWNLQTLLQPNNLAHIFLLNLVLAPEQLTSSTVFPALGGILLLFIAALVVSTRAHHDRLREIVTLAARTTLHSAHGELVSKLNDTAWRRQPSVTEKLAQSAQHLRDISLKTAKKMMFKVLGAQALQWGVSLAFAAVAVISGVILSIVISTLT